MMQPRLIPADGGGNRPDTYDIIIKLGHPVALHKRTEKQSPWLFQAKEPLERLPAWEAPVIAILGSFDAGKTWLINQLLSGATRLATGLDVHTEGLSYKKITHQKKDLIFLDSAGSDHLIRMSSASTEQVQNKELEDLLTRQFLFELADVFIFVVNEITLTEQIMIAKFVNKVKNSNKAFKEVYVIHNFKSSTTPQLVDKQWQEVKDHYSFLREQSTLTPAIAANNQPDSKLVPWLGGVDNQRHLYLAADGSEAGFAHNAFCIQFLLFSLVSSVVVVEPFKVLDKFKDACKKILSLCLRIGGPGNDQWDISLQSPSIVEDDDLLSDPDTTIEPTPDANGYHTYEIVLTSEQEFSVSLQEYFQQRLDLMNSVGNLLQDPDFPFQMNIYEKKSKNEEGADEIVYVMKIAVPYYNDSRVFKMKNNHLRVGIKTRDLDKEGKEITREYSSGIKAGKFEKLFHIPSDFDALRHKAPIYGDGILTIIVPPIPPIVNSDPDWD